jgi:leucyl/phenylalanyl-tRNA--protein transferase
LPAYGIDLIDCQVRTDHMMRFGAEGWPREKFLAALAERMQRPTRKGPWRAAADA